MSIEYVYNTSFSLDNESKVSKWLNKAVESEGFSVGEIVFAFFNDKDLKSLNIKYLDHSSMTETQQMRDKEDDNLKSFHVEQ